MRRHTLYVSIAAVAIAAPVFAQPADLRTKVRARVEKEMEAQKIVGMCVAVGLEGKIAAAESFGFEDREAGTAASEQTMFRWASVSKPMTAVVVMQLSKEGKLDLDADVRKLVPEFPEKPWPVTSRQLLCHQGGIVHYVNGKVIKTERTYEQAHPFADTVLALDFFKESPLLSEPGTKYSYTTHGFMLLGAVAQRAGGEPFAELVKKRIAGTCGMTTLRPDYQWEDIPHRAVGYRKDGTGAKAPSTNTDVSWKLPGGGWISTATDMARFGLGMMTGKLVDDATRESMWTRQKTRDGAETGYGLGFVVGNFLDERVVEHSGSQEKSKTFLLLLPERGVCVAVMANTEDATLSPLTRDLARIASEGVAKASKEALPEGK